MNLMKAVLFLTLLSFAKTGWADSDFIHAGWRGEIDTLKSSLARGVDVNAVDPEWGTALVGAVSNGRLEALKLLLEAGANIDQVVNLNRCPCADTALRIAVQYHGLNTAKNAHHLEIAKMLLEAGADVNISVEGTTSLMTAIALEDTQMIQLLRQHGATIDAPVELLLAAMEGDTKKVTTLLELIFLRLLSAVS